jgi:RimJ/RimL family protein N-acetyltransferase
MTCIVDLENLPSLRVAEKIGFRRIDKLMLKGRSSAIFERWTLRG